MIQNVAHGKLKNKDCERVLGRARKEKEDNVQKVTEGVDNVKVGVDDSNARCTRLRRPR